MNSTDNTPIGNPSDTAAETVAPSQGFDRLRICTNFRAGDILPSCGAQGSKELARALREEIEKHGDFIRLETVHCMGRCHIGPTLKLLPRGPFLQQVGVEDVPRLVDMLQSGDIDSLAAEFPAPGTGSGTGGPQR